MVLPEHFASHNNSVSHGKKELCPRLSRKYSIYPHAAKQLFSNLILGRTPGYTWFDPMLLKLFFHFWVHSHLMSIHKAPQITPIHTWNPLLLCWSTKLLFISWMDIRCTCVRFFISDEGKKKVKVRIQRVPISHEELGLNDKHGDKARWCDLLRGGSPGLSPGCCRVREK